MSISITENELCLYKGAGKIIPCKCINCESEYFATKSDAYRVFKGTLVKKYCSRKCCDTHRHGITKNNIPCDNCGTVFEKYIRHTGSNNFCSQRCAAVFSNKIRNDMRISKTPDCIVCGKKTGRGSKAFCSLKCNKIYDFNQRISDWKAGKLCGHTGKAMTVKVFLRRYLIDVAGNKCSKCGWCELHPITGKSPLEINHIDGNAENTTPDNLEVLCPNCHALTPNFRALNKNSARSGRRKDVVSPLKEVAESVEEFASS